MNHSPRLPILALALALALSLASSHADQQEAGGDLELKLKAYFAAGEEKRANTAAFWGALDSLKEDQVEPARAAIFAAAKERAIEDGREEQFSKGEMLFDNPFGLDQDCPMPFVIKTKGEKPEAGWPAFINIHGSGPIDREYEIHQKRHRFYSGKLVVPRSPHQGILTPGEKGKVGIWRHALVPAIEQLDGYWGRSVINCPFCSGFEVKGRAWGVLADRPEVLAAAEVYRNWTDDLFLFVADLGVGGLVGGILAGDEEEGRKEEDCLWCIHGLVVVRR